MRSDGLSHAYLLTVGSPEGADVEADLATLGERWTAVEWLDDVAAALLASDVVCLPTHREGFPNVVLEAASAGRAVVTTDATGARDSVIDGVTGLVVPVADARSLAAALTRLAADPALRDRLGAQARERVQRDFAPADVWRGLEEVYRRPPGTARRGAAQSTDAKDSRYRTR